MPGMTIRWRPGTLIVFVALSVSLLGAPDVAQRTRSLAPAHTYVLAPVQVRPAILPAGYGRLPLGFEINRGQAAGQVRFLAHGNGYTLFLTPSEAVFAMATAPPASSLTPAALAPSAVGRALHESVLRLRFVGANPRSRLIGLDRLPGASNYFIGADPRRWHSGVATYARVAYCDLYPGVDLVYHGTAGRVEYDLVVAPRARTQEIMLSIQGARGLRLDARGNLVLHTPDGDLVQAAPVAYQTVADRRHRVTSRYKLLGHDRVGFAVGSYDSRHPLVIDPTLRYSTYLGGSNADKAYAIAVDSSGNAYVTGFTVSTNFPTTTGVFSPTAGGIGEVFVSKLNATGTALVYSTYLGGTIAYGLGIAVDSAGNAYVTGTNVFGSFPTTPSSFQPTAGGQSDAFVTKLNASGSALVYSSYFGGSGLEIGTAIAVDSAGNAYITGATNSLSTTFPLVNPIQNNLGGFADAYVAKINAAGSALVYSTYLGGSDLDFGRGIAVDSSGNAYVTGLTSSTDFPTVNALQATNAGGSDAFVSEVNAAGSALVFSTYFGGNGYDVGNGIAVGSQGGIFITGSTNAISNTFPISGAIQSTPGGGEDAFVAKLYPGGKPLLYSTYLGGNGDDTGNGIAVDSNGNAYVVGTTDSISNTFPITNAVQATPGGGDDAFVAKFNAYGTSLLYSTFLGGSNDDFGSGIVVDSSGNAYIGGETTSTNFPTMSGAYATSAPGAGDAFIAKISTP